MWLVALWPFEKARPNQIAALLKCRFHLPIVVATTLNLSCKQTGREGGDVNQEVLSSTFTSATNHTKSVSGLRPPSLNR